MTRIHRADAIRALAAGLTMPLAATPLAARAQAATPLRIALFPSETAGQFYYGRELGLFDRAGLAIELTELKNGAAIAAAVASGSIDIGISNLVTMAIGHERGLPFTLIACGGLSLASAPTNGILGVAATSPVRSAKDLTGKTIAVDGIGTLPNLAARLWIDSNGGDSSAVKFIELGFPEMPEAVRLGRVDAAVMNLSIAPTIGKPGDPLRVLAAVYDAVSPRFAGSVWFASADWVAKNAETTRKFVGVMREASTWANAHHREAAASIAKFMKTTIEHVEGTPRIVFTADITPALVQPVIDMSAKYGRIKAAFPARDLIATR